MKIKNFVFGCMILVSGQCYANISSTDSIINKSSPSSTSDKLSDFKGSWYGSCQDEYSSFDIQFDIEQTKDIVIMTRDGETEAYPFTNHTSLLPYGDMRYTMGNTVEYYASTDFFNNLLDLNKTATSTGDRTSKDQVNYVFEKINYNNLSLRIMKVIYLSNNGTSETVSRCSLQRVQ